MRKLLLVTVAAAALGACSKSAAPAPQAAPTPAPAPAPSPAPTATPTAPAPSPSPAPAAAPSAAPAQAPTPTPAAQPAASATPAETAPLAAKPPSQNLLDNDLQNLEVAVRLMDAFKVDEGKAQFEFKTIMADGTSPIDEVFDLEETQGVTSGNLQREARPGFYFKTYRLKDIDRERMSAAQQKLDALRQQSSGGNELIFQASVQTRIAENIEPPETFSLTLYARSHPGVDFGQLAEERIVRRGDPDAGQLFGTAAS